ncbi:RsmD family RNA methyltransferase [Bacteroides sp.]|uniref:RsmD family RNA methyltransferase n=1 Tax=Bacteroides sp. TaxID=29523 RepID=UPI003AB23D50
MRVISGIYKRRRFDVPHSFKARPTTDFAKENLFNVLSNHIDFEDGVRALDLFAGTGSISIELVSRGCDQVVSVEKDRNHYAFICKVMQEVKTDKCLPIRGDVFKYIKSGREQFDFIFADPPYELTGLETLPDLIFDNNLLKEGGLFVLEHGKKDGFEEHPHFVERRAYGSVNFSFFRLEDSHTSDEDSRSSD